METDSEKMPILPVLEGFAGRCPSEERMALLARPMSWTNRLEIQHSPCLQHSSREALTVFTRTESRGYDPVGDATIGDHSSHLSVIAFGEILSLVSEIADVLGGILALGFTLPVQVAVPVTRPDQTITHNRLCIWHTGVDQEPRETASKDQKTK